MEAHIEQRGTDCAITQQLNRLKPESRKGRKPTQQANHEDQARGFRKPVRALSQSPKNTNQGTPDHIHSQRTHRNGHVFSQVVCTTRGQIAQYRTSKATKANQ